MQADIFEQMMEGLRSVGKGGGKKAKLKFDAQDPNPVVEFAETDIAPMQSGDIVNPYTFIGPPTTTEGVNRTDLNEQESQRKKLPLPDQMMPLPVPEMDAGVREPTALIKKSSTQKVVAPRSAAAKQTKAVLEGTLKEEAEPAKEDERMSSLQSRQSELDKERMASLEKAAHAQDLSTEEMIAMALVTLLPTIVGGIAGSAVAGKTGGAAGVAGGLGGASQGIQYALADKRKNQEQALEQAAQAGSRSDRVEAEMAQRQGQLEQLGESAKTRAQNKELTLIKEKGDAQRAAAANAAHLKAANISAYSHLRGAEIAAGSALAKAEARAKAAEEGGSLKEYQGKASTFATGMLSAEHVLRQVKDPTFLNSFRSWGTLKNAMADPEQQTYARAVYGFLDAVARDESGAAINEGEWDQYFNTYFPRNTSSQQDIDYAAKLRGTRVRNMLGKAGPLGAKIAVESYQQEFGAPQQQQQSQPGAGNTPPAQNDRPLTSKWGAGR